MKTTSRSENYQKYFSRLEQRNVQHLKDPLWFSVESKAFIVMTNSAAVALQPNIQFSSVAQSCPTLCDPMNRSTPGLPVYHQLLEFTQTHVHRVGDAIQSSHPLSSPSPPAPNPSIISWGVMLASVHLTLLSLASQVAQG